MSKQITILLAEDSPDDVFFFRRGLQKSGAHVQLSVAESGQQAIDYLSDRNGCADELSGKQPDFVFVDLKMPEVDGFEVLEWIVKNYRMPPFEIIVLTSSDEPRDYQRALELGAHRYCLKPISAEQLSLIFDRQKAASVASST